MTATHPAFTITQYRGGIIFEFSDHQGGIARFALDPAVAAQFLDDFADMVCRAISDASRLPPGWHRCHRSPRQPNVATGRKCLT
jgi:hypothetical protein